MNIDFNKMREDGFYNRVLNDKKKMIDKIDTQIGWTDVESCPICGDTEINGTRFKPIKYNFCKTCDCLYATEIPKQTNQTEYGSEDISEILNSSDEKKRQYKQQRFMTERIGYIKRYINKPSSQATLLDFGCNTGSFLEIAKRHFKEVEGIEQNKAMVSYIKHMLKISVNTNILPDYHMCNMDVITLFDVIEHIENPLQIIYALKHKLTTDGILFIYTPNWRSLCFDLLQDESTQYMPADHLLFFSRETIIYIANKLDMQIDLYETRGMDWFDILAYERDINKVNIDNTTIKENVNKLQHQTDNRQYANHSRIILRKVD